jgi:hypothetical protein
MLDCNSISTRHRWVSMLMPVNFHTSANIYRHSGRSLVHKTGKKS